MTKAPTPEEIEAVARAICPEGFAWLDDLAANPPRNIEHTEGVERAEDDPRLYDPWPARIDDARVKATAVIQALRSLAPPGEDVAGLVAEARAFASMADRRNLPDDAALFIRLANALDNQHP